MESLVEILIPLGVCVALPVLTVYLSMKKSNFKEKCRTDVMLAAIERNPDTDISDLSRLFPEKKRRTLMGTALLYLAWGLGLVCIGIGVLVTSFIFTFEALWFFTGITSLLIGGSLAGMYFITKREALRQEALNSNKTDDSAAGE